MTIGEALPRQWLLRGIKPLALAAIFPAFVIAQAPPAAPAVIIYRGASLIDGTGAPLRSDVSIVTRGALIEAVADGQLATPPTATSSNAAAAHFIDITGEDLFA